MRKNDWLQDRPGSRGTGLCEVLGRRCLTAAWLVAAMSLLCGLLWLSACSDAVLEPDGSISYPGNTLRIETESVFHPESSSQVTTGGEVETDPPLVLLPSTDASTDTTGPHLTLVTEEPDGGTTEAHLTLPTTNPSPDIDSSFYMEFLSTGKSDCILILLDGKCVLIDTADKDDNTLICETLDGHGIKHIDYLILTHFDNDHIGSAATLLKRYTVGDVYMPDYARDSKLYRQMDAALTTAKGVGTTVHRLYAQDVELTIGTGSLWINATAMEGYEPGQTLGADEDNDRNEENNFSLITALRYEDTTAIFCGDAEKERMAEYLPLAQARGITSCTLLKIPHHGSSSSTALSDAVRAWKPRICVVCTDAEENVAAAVITNMRAVGAGAYFTYRGTICFAADGTVVYK